MPAERLGNSPSSVPRVSGGDQYITRLQPIGLALNAGFSSSFIFLRDKQPLRSTVTTCHNNGRLRIYAFLYRFFRLCLGSEPTHLRPPQSILQSCLQPWSARIPPTHLLIGGSKLSLRLHASRRACERRPMVSALGSRADKSWGDGRRPSWRQYSWRDWRDTSVDVMEGEDAEQTLGVNSCSIRPALLCT